MGIFGVGFWFACLEFDADIIENNIYKSFYNESGEYGSAQSNYNNKSNRE